VCLSSSNFAENMRFELYNFRGLAEIKDSQRKAQAQAEELKNVLDEHFLELRVKAAHETESACQERLATAKAEIAELRTQLDLSERYALSWYHIQGHSLYSFHRFGGINQYYIAFSFAGRFWNLRRVLKLKSRRQRHPLLKWRYNHPSARFSYFNVLKEFIRNLKVEMLVSHQYFTSLDYRSSL